MQIFDTIVVLKICYKTYYKASALSIYLIISKIIIYAKLVNYITKVLQNA
jgi:hypothetical protein